MKVKLVALSLCDPKLTPRLLEKLEVVIPSGDPLNTFCAACRSNPGDFDKALEVLTDADRATVYGILAHDLDNVDRAFDHGLRLYRTLKGGAAHAPHKPVIDPHAEYQAALRELVDALPEQKRGPAHKRFHVHMLDGRPVSLATPAELQADAEAFRACACDWRAGRRSNPACYRSSVPSAAPSTQVGA